MAAKVSAIIADCVQQGLGLPRDPIALDILELALGFYNTRGRIIFDSWPWDNRKADEFTATADASGYIAMPITIGVVRAVRQMTPVGDGVRIWAQDELLAAAQGESVASDRFFHVADAAGCKRIRVDAAEAAGKSYRVLALLRWVDVTIESTYSALAPTATPTDYRVATFPLEFAEPALREAVMDGLRSFDGEAERGEWQALVRQGHKVENQDADRELRVNPRSPMFEEIGNWDR